jgi:NTE family protein
LDLFIYQKVSKEELNKRRAEFRSKIPPIKVSNITNNKEKNSDYRFASNALLREKKSEILDYNTLTKRYFRLYATQQIEYIYPTLDLKKDSTHQLNLVVTKAKDFRVDIGGHFSSRAVNTGYLGLTYRGVGKIAYALHGESYFGKFYGSARADLTVEVFSIE